jgi:hypothetical protein
LKLEQRKKIMHEKQSWNNESKVKRNEKLSWKKKKPIKWNAKLELIN